MCANHRDFSKFACGARLLQDFTLTTNDCGRCYAGGWTDPEFGNEIALVSLFDGTAFVDITDPVNPIVLGKLDTHTIGSDWGDIKVYDNVAFIGSEAVDHGMQIHDLLV